MHVKHSLVALLPMKGHSERVPGKNFRLFAGKPLFRWVLDTLLSVPEIDLVVINTDARGELHLGDAHRVLVRDRRQDICGDLVSMNKVIADDLAAVDSDLYLMTHATNPLLTSETIRRAIMAFEVSRRAGSADSLFAVNRFQSRFYDSSGTPLNHDPTELIRTQDLPPLFEENSNLYLFTRDSFDATGARIGRRPLLFETPRSESMDIDDGEGWRIAEAIACAAQQRGGN